MSYRTIFLRVMDHCQATHEDMDVANAAWVWYCEVVSATPTDWSTSRCQLLEEAAWHYILTDDDSFHDIDMLNGLVRGYTTSKPCGYPTTSSVSSCASSLETSVVV